MIPDRPVAPSEPALGPVAAPIAQPPKPRVAETTADRRGRRSLTIRLKLTLWYSCLFLLAGVLLIAINFFLVRDSLSIAPGKAKAAVAERYGIPEEILDFGAGPGQRGEMPRYVTINGIPVGRLLDEAQHELRAEALRQLWIKSLLALAIMVVITFGLAWLVAGRMLRPLQAITDTARRLSSSTLHKRIALRGPRDELKELADTFDDMLGRLDMAFTAQKEFVANASHELRTPLTIIRTEIDVALSDPDLSPEELREMGAAVSEAVNRSERLIDGLLVLARAENSLSFAELDLAEIAEAQLRSASSAADALDLRLDLNLQSTPMQGDRALLERLVGNLVENAIRHNAAGGSFAVRTFAAGNQAVLKVVGGDTVISYEDLERLFERFYRPDRSRSRKTGGFGLGLSIVKSVAAAHGGTVELVAIPTGGLDVTVSLPARLRADPGSGS
jgi:signal transduction histidine kinase